MAAQGNWEDVVCYILLSSYKEMNQLFIDVEKSLWVIAIT